MVLELEEEDMFFKRRGEEINLSNELDIIGKNIFIEKKAGIGNKNPDYELDLFGIANFRPIDNININFGHTGTGGISLEMTENGGVTHIPTWFISSDFSWIVGEDVLPKMTLDSSGNLNVTGTIIGSNTASVIDDGTNYVFYLGAVKLFQIVKASGQMQVAGGYDSDITL